jgi:hypothetical protein
LCNGSAHPRRWPMRRTVSTTKFGLGSGQRSPPPSCSDSAAGESDLPTPGLRSRDSSGSGGGCGARTPWRASRVLAGCDSDPKPSGSRARPRNSDANAGIRVPRSPMKLCRPPPIPMGGGAAHRTSSIHVSDPPTSRRLRKIPRSSNGISPGQIAPKLRAATPAIRGYLSNTQHFRSERQSSQNP